MDKLRNGETSIHPFRSERMFTIGHEWFFATREGPEQGPYTSRELAERALSTFIIRIGTSSHWSANRPH